MTLHASLSQVMVNQHKESAVAFLEAAVAYFGQLGIRIERGTRRGFATSSRSS